MKAAQERRRENRLPIESAILPFLGTRQSDHQPFQYLLHDLSSSGLQISIPRWVQRRERVFPDESVSLHLPFRLGGATYVAGRIAWERWDQEIEAQLCGIVLQEIYPELFPVVIALDKQEVSVDLSAFVELPSSAKMGTLVRTVLKDALLLKRGMHIYFRHLRAYFSRMVMISRDEFEQFSQVVIRDISRKVLDDQRRLHDMYRQLRRKGQSDILDSLDLEAVRSILEPSIYVELFRPLLESDVFSRYFQALTALERKGLTHNNTLVLLYIRSLTEPST